MSARIRYVLAALHKEWQGVNVQIIGHHISDIKFGCKNWPGAVPLKLSVSTSGKDISCSQK